MLVLAKATITAIGTLIAVGNHIHVITSALNINSPTPPTPHITDYFSVKESFADLQQEYGDSIFHDPGELMRTTFINLDGMRNDLDKIDYNLGIIQEYNTGVFGWADPALIQMILSYQVAINSKNIRQFNHAKTSVLSSRINSKKTQATNQEELSPLQYKNGQHNATANPL